MKYKQYIKDLQSLSVSYLLNGMDEALLSFFDFNGLYHGARPAYKQEYLQVAQCINSIKQSVASLLVQQVNPLLKQVLQRQVAALQVIVNRHTHTMASWMLERDLVSEICRAAVKDRLLKDFDIYVLCSYRRIYISLASQRYDVQYTSAMQKSFITMFQHAFSKVNASTHDGGDCRLQKESIQQCVQSALSPPNFSYVADLKSASGYRRIEIFQPSKVPCTLPNQRGLKEQLKVGACHQHEYVIRVSINKVATAQHYADLNVPQPFYLSCKAAEADVKKWVNLELSCIVDKKLVSGGPKALTSSMMAEMMPAIIQRTAIRLPGCDLAKQVPSAEKHIQPYEKAMQEYVAGFLHAARLRPICYRHQEECRKLVAFGFKSQPLERLIPKSSQVWYVQTVSRALIAFMRAHCFDEPGIGKIFSEMPWLRTVKNTSVADIMRLLHCVKVESNVQGLNIPHVRGYPRLVCRLVAEKFLEIMLRILSKSEFRQQELCESGLASKLLVNAVFQKKDVGMLLKKSIAQCFHQMRSRCGSKTAVSVLADFRSYLKHKDFLLQYSKDKHALNVDDDFTSRKILFDFMLGVDQLLQNMPTPSWRPDKQYQLIWGFIAGHEVDFDVPPSYGAELSLLRKLGFDVAESVWSDAASSSNATDVSKVKNTRVKRKKKRKKKGGRKKNGKKKNTSAVASDESRAAGCSVNPPENSMALTYAYYMDFSVDSQSKMQRFLSVDAQLDACLEQRLMMSYLTERPPSSIAKVGFWKLLFGGQKLSFMTSLMLQDHVGSGRSTVENGQCVLVLRLFLLVRVADSMKQCRKGLGDLNAYPVNHSRAMKTALRNILRQDGDRSIPESLPKVCHERTQKSIVYEVLRRTTGKLTGWYDFAINHPDCQRRGFLLEALYHSVEVLYDVDTLSHTLALMCKQASGRKSQSPTGSSQLMRQLMQSKEKLYTGIDQLFSL